MISGHYNYTFDEGTEATDNEIGAATERNGNTTPHLALMVMAVVVL
jgi:hypothetical protein